MVGAKDNACTPGCPVQRAAEIIDGKWTTLIIRELLSGKKRYSELQKGLEGISPKVLAARLKLLVEKGLVERTVYPTIPPATEYELTNLGKQLKRVISAMAEFGSLLQKV
jgi:DNA-binding HxlR family transcriptional regulator